MPTTRRLTMGQAIVEFLIAQHTSLDGVEQPFFGGVFTIFGHGNVAGIGQALLQAKDRLPCYFPRNEQAMVHTAVGFAKMANRRRTLACTSSIGPGATNMLTGAALATINRLPVLLLPGDIFATRGAGAGAAAARVAGVAGRVGQRLLPAGLEILGSHQPSRTTDHRAARSAAHPDLPGRDGRGHAVPAAGRAGRGLRLSRALFRKRRLDDRTAAPGCGPARSGRGVAALGDRAGDHRRRRRHLQRGDRGAGARSRPPPAFPSSRRWPGRERLRFDHPQALGAVGVTGAAGANRIAREADLVIVVGSRLSDFTTASKTAFRHPGVRFVNVNITAFDAGKHHGLALVGDARATLDEWLPLMQGWQTSAGYQARVAREKIDWEAEVDRVYAASGQPVMSQAEVVGILNDCTRPSRRHRQRGRQPAGRPAQAVARARSEAVPPGIRLLVHGIRGGGRPRGQAGGPGPRRLRPGRRRVLSDDGPGDRHVHPGRRAPDRRGVRQPGLREHRRAVASGGLRGLPDPLSPPGQPDRPARRRGRRRRFRGQRRIARGTRHPRVYSRRRCAPRSKPRGTRTAPPPSSFRWTSSSGSAATSRGGTCRLPRSRPSRPCSRRARYVRARKAERDFL